MIINKRIQHLFDVLESESKKDKVQYFPYVSQEAIENAKATCVKWDVNDVSKILGRQYRTTLKKLYPLLFHIKKHVKNNIVFISQTDKTLLMYYKSQERIFDLLHRVVEKKAKVIYDLKSDYQPQKIAKYYYVCYENLDNMFSLYEELYGKDETHLLYGSTGKLIRIDETNTEYRYLPAYYLGPQLINSKLSIDLEKYDQEEVEKAVYQHYMAIPYYKKLVDSLNKLVVKDEEKIWFELSINKKHRYITNIGIRAFSHVCLLESLDKRKIKSEINGEPFVIDENILYREKYLRERFNGDYEEYDINASILRVSHASKNGWDMGDLSEDLYETLFKPFSEDYKRYFNPVVDGWCTEMREFFKKMFMRLYFGGTVETIMKNLFWSESCKKKKMIDAGESVDDRIWFSGLKSQGVDIASIICKWQNAVFDYCGRNEYDMNDTSVFLHESCIYLEVRKELALRGIDVVQVYDGFYFKKGTMPSDMDDIIKKSAIAYSKSKRKYMIYLKIKETRSQYLAMSEEERRNFMKNMLDTTKCTELLDDGIVTNIKYVV